MPRYFFDLDLNGQAQKDTTGRELKDREEARKQALDVIDAIARIWDQAADLKCACTVRDEEGGHVYRNSLSSAAVTPEVLQAVVERNARRAVAREARLAAQGQKTKGRTQP